MDWSHLDIILIISLTYVGGVLSGLGFCAKYRNIFLSRSKSMDNLKQHNHQNLIYPPNANVSPVIQATAPPPTNPNPLKLTIE
jgi:hypothetical protein